MENKPIVPCGNRKCPYCAFDFITKSTWCTFDIDYFGYCYLENKNKKAIKNNSGDTSK
jgi:hypothetical protein